MISKELFTVRYGRYMADIIDDVSSICLYDKEWQSILAHANAKSIFFQTFVLAVFHHGVMDRDIVIGASLKNMI